MNDKTNKEVKDALVKINRERYTTSRTASGAKSLSNGDDIAKALEGLPIVSLYEVADKLFVENEFRANYGKLNTGMQRMNLGNRIRGFVSKRDADNAKAEADGKKPKLSGLEAVAKAAAPFRKEADKALAEAEKAKEAKKAEAAKKKAEAEAKKKKAEHNKKASAA